MDESAPRITLGSLLGTFFSLIGDYAQVLLLATFALAAFDTALVTGMGNHAGFIGNVASIGVVFLVLRHLLREEGLVASEGGFAPYFRASLLSGLGVFAGLVLLIVPGLYLLARWSIAPALVITRNLKATEALGASWGATRHCAWMLSLVYLTGFLILMVPMLLIGGVAGLTGQGASLVVTGLSQLAGDFVAVAGAFLNVAIYRHVVGNAHELEEVFS